VPIKSQKEWKFLAVNHPDVLHKLQQDQPVVYSKLPVAVGQKDRLRPRLKAWRKRR